MASVVYNNAKEQLLLGTIDLSSDTIQMILLKGVTTTPDDEDHVFLDDITADEADATNYVRKTLSSKTVTQNDTNDRAEFDFDDVVWSTLGGTTDNTIVGAAIFKSETTDSDSPLISFHDFGNTTTDGTDFTLQVGTAGAIHAV